MLSAFSDYNCISTGYQVVQIRMIFSLSKTALERLFPPHIQCPTHMAYVEWFTPFKSTPESHHLMYKVSRDVRDGHRVASIVNVQDIRRSVLLCPKFGPVVPPGWTSESVLERCTNFFVNSHTDRHTFITLV